MAFEIVRRGNDEHCEQACEQKQQYDCTIPTTFWKIKKKRNTVLTLTTSKPT